ncbi:MAG: DM13 domain-containing protein [Acidimicrobiales bacterium]
MARGLQRRWWLIGGAVFAVVIAIVLVWFQPQKLYIDDRADEALPTAETSSTIAVVGGANSSSTVDPEDAVVDLATGSFVSRDHTTTGVVRVVELADGRRFLRLEDLETDNGPDLYVYLAKTAANGSEASFDDDFVSLGHLKGNLGNQNYELSPEINVADWASVVIWCDRFNSAFGAADLHAA